MNRNTRTHTARRSRRLLARLRAAALAATLMGALALLGLAAHPTTTATALAAESQLARQAPEPERQATQAPRSAQLVFSLGVLTAVDGQTVTLSFVDGAPETYRIGPQTTIQSQHGDAQSVSDLEVGAEVIVLSQEGDPTALTIVNGGDGGFAKAGPADLRGHEQDESCAPCAGAAAP